MEVAEADPSQIVQPEPKLVKRGRGRPRLYARDEYNNPIRPPGVKAFKKTKAHRIMERSFDSENEATPESDTRPKRATRGKVPQRFIDTLLSEKEVEEAEEEEEEGVKATPRSRGRPARAARPPSPENNGNPDVTVNIAVKDKSCAQHLDLMGVYILYYCRKCAFSSKQMADITDHIKAGEHLSQPVEALEGVVMEDQSVETFVSEPLVSEALTDVAREDLQNIVANDKIIKTGGKYVKVDEHSYAEVKVDKGGVMSLPTAKGDAESAVGEITEAMETTQTEETTERVAETAEAVAATMEGVAETAEAVTETTEVTDATDAGEVAEEVIEDTQTVKEREAAEMSDDSVGDPDFDAGKAKDEEADSDHEIDSDGDYVDEEQPKKRGRKRTHSESDSLIFEDEKFEENSDLEEDPMVPRRYTCPQCPYIVLFSFHDFKEHRRCHKNSRDTTLFCYICQMSGRKKVMSGEPWGRMKSHLGLVHMVNFQLRCPICAVQMSQHSLFVRHYKSHLHSCKYEFCRYDTPNEEDMRLHTKSHSESNPRHFKCPLCKFSSKLKPWKWPIMHYHLVTKHDRAMNANFTCKACGAGFFDTNSYIDHKYACGKEEFTKCDLCSQEIPKSSLVRHAVWHSRKDEGLVPADEKFEVRTVKASEETEVDRLSNLEDGQTEEQRRIIVDLTNNQTGEATEAVIMVETTSGTAADAEATEGEPVEDNENTQPPDPQAPDSQLPDTLQPDSQVSLEDQMASKAIAIAEDVSKDDSEVLVQEADTWQCVEHGETFESAADLTHHYITIHWGLSEERILAARREVEKRLQDRADRVFPSTEDRDVIRQVEQARQSLRSGIQEKCQYCYKSFASTPRLLRHLSRCHTEEKLKPLPCPNCSKLFRNRVQLRNHYRIVHEGIKRKKPDVPYKARRRLFVCELCGYTTPENIRLKNHHLSVHAGIMPYACDICPYKTNEKSDLRRHVAKHEGRKRHTCDYCDYKTDQRWLLVNHCVRQHNVQLAKNNRDTRGLTFGSRRKVEQPQQGQPQIEQVIVEGGEEISLETLENLVQLQAVQNGEEVTIWMTTSDEYEAATNATEEKTGEEVMTVETIENAGEEEMSEQPQVVYVTEQQEEEKEEAETQQIVYVREDGTIISAEELMTMTVEGQDQIEYAPEVEQQTLVIEPEAMQIQEVAENAIDLQQEGVVIQEIQEA